MSTPRWNAPSPLNEAGIAPSLWPLQGRHNEFIRHALIRSTVKVHSTAAWTSAGIRRSDCFSPEGVIEQAEVRNGYGKTIIINHGHGYAHSVWTHVRIRGHSRPARSARGDVIGYVGLSGRSTGPHLH